MTQITVTTEAARSSAAKAEACARALDKALDDGDARTIIAAAVEVKSTADSALAAAIRAARAHGATWQLVGDALGITRQAAFQRFGRPTDPRTGEPMDTQPFPNAPERARGVFADLQSGRWDAVTTHFDETMLEKLDDNALSTMWARLVARFGELESIGSASPQRAADLTVTDVALSFEAAEMVGRVSSRENGEVAGLFILTPEQARSL